MAEPIKLHLSMPARETVRLEGGKYRKEILRVGEWHGNTADGKPYKVTRDTLTRLVENFNKGKSVGLSCPLQWGHNDDPQKRLGSVVELENVGDVLYSVSTIPNGDEAEKALLSDTSVEVTKNYIDGYGNRYSEMLTHLAVVTHPAVPNQGPFVALSLRDKPMPKKWATQLIGKKFVTWQLAEGDSAPDGAITTDAPPDGAVEAPAFDDDQAAWLVENLNQYIEYNEDKPLSTDTTGANFAERLSAFLYYTVTQDNGEEGSEPITDDTASEVADSTDPVQMGAKKTAKVTQLQSLQAQLAAANNKIQLAAKSAFESKAVQLMNAGRLTVQAKNTAIQLAAKSDYDLSILDGIALPESMAVAPSAAAKVMAQLSAKGKSPESKSVDEMTIGERREHGLRRAGFAVPKKS